MTTTRVRQGSVKTFFERLALDDDLALGPCSISPYLHAKQLSDGRIRRSGTIVASGRNGHLHYNTDRRHASRSISLQRIAGR